MSKWITVREAAQHLALSESSIRKHIESKTEIGKLFYKVGGAIRADLFEIDRFIKRCAL